MSVRCSKRRPSETRHARRADEYEARIMTIKTVGFIGIGNMGRPMAANLIKGGFDLVAYDTDIDRAAKFAEECDGDCAATLADLGKRVDAIVTMLPTGK